MRKTVRDDNMPDDRVPAATPSLARAFEEQRALLHATISDQDLSSSKAVSAARRALDKTAVRFADQTQDIQLQKAGLWLLEMVKSGAGVLDRAARADIVWQEVPKLSKRTLAGSTLFYTSALIFIAAGFIQGSRLTMLAGITLSAMRFFDPKDWKYFLSKIPLIGRKKTPLLTNQSGQNFKANAHILVEAQGYVDALADALKTADHILLRLAEPQAQTGWNDDKRLLGFVQNLLEAKAVNDGDFALKLISTELESILRADGIEIVNYTPKKAFMFDVLPALDLQSGKMEQAAPALVKNGDIVRRGTVWSAGQ